MEHWLRIRNKLYFIRERGSYGKSLSLIGFDSVGKTFSLHSKDKNYFFYRTRGDKVSNEAVEIGTNKETTKHYLTKAGVPNPEGFGFTSNDNKKEVINNALQLGFPLVLKPTFGSLGKGVITNIKSVKVLRDSLSYVISEFEYTDYVIERYVEGDDLRVYVIENEAVCVTKRIPASVTGDGTNTIEKLIDLKNEIRKTNPQTSTRLIKVDKGVTDFLSQQNLKLNDVPQKAKGIYLKGQSNISSGGDSIDITSELPTKIKGGCN